MTETMEILSLISADANLRHEGCGPVASRNLRDEYTAYCRQCTWVTHYPQHAINRLRAAGITTVTTGFFRPQYFYAHGFRIEKRYAGLVKSLTEKENRGQDTN